MRYRIFFTVLVVCCFCGLAFSQDLSRQTIPGKWVEPLLPEDLSKLEYPAYAKPIDKARMESFAGEYKRSLRTLAKIKDGEADPVELAIVKATSLAAIGQRDEALKVLTDPAVADNPRVQVRRADVLAQMGRLDE